MYIKLLQAGSWICVWPIKGQMPGTCWDTAVPSAGSAAQHISFAMRREKFHQDRLLLVYGSAVESLEELPEEQGRGAVPTPCCHEPVVMWGNTNSQSQQQKYTWILEGECIKSPKLLILFFVAAWAWVKSMHLPSTTHSQSLSLGTSPLRHSSGSRRKSNNFYKPPQWVFLWSQNWRG